MKIFLSFLCALFVLPCAMAAAELSEVGRVQLEADWLVQCDNQPTAERTQQEIGWTRQLAARIAKMPKAPAFDSQLAKLGAIEKQLQQKKGTAKQLYFAVRRIKREIIFANPVVDFEKVVLIDNTKPRTDHESAHRMGTSGIDGGRLLVTGLQPGGKTVNLFEGKEGAFWRPDVHFDGNKVLVSFKPKGESSFHLYEVELTQEGTAAGEARQLTFGDYDDLDPIYTPDGKITFSTSRAHTYVRCLPASYAFVIGRCDADGKNIYVVSRNNEPEYMPSVLNDGRIIYTRWEYTEKALWRIQSLWTMNPDGTNAQVFWGNQSRWPDVLTEARAIPGSRRIMFTGVGHHQWFDGCIGIIDPDRGLNFPDGLTKVTPDVAWPEVGDGPGCPAESKDYHTNGGFAAYKTPYPLSAEDFLCSASHAKPSQGDGFGFSDADRGRNAAKKSHFNLYLMDIYGNRELIHQGEQNAYYAMPLRSRKRPPVLPDRVAWPKLGSAEPPKRGVLYSNDVFNNAPEVLRGKGKYIRVVAMDPKNYTTFNKVVQHDGPAVSVFQADGVKRILGTVPIEEDGSICLSLPPGVAFHFQMLDAKQQCIHVMRSFTGVMPGETRGCFGCHESKLETRGNLVSPNSIAMRKGPVEPTPPSWGYKTSVSYLRFVQPVLDKNCGKCHQDPKHKAFAKLNMTLRPSAHPWRTRVGSRPGDSSPFTEPYLTLVGGRQGWGGRQKKMPLSGVYVVEAYNSGDGNGSDLKTLPPYSAFSPRSKLIENASSGKHNGVKVSAEDLEKLVAWVDLNGPYLGDEEIRQMYDPYFTKTRGLPVPSRVATAPVIDRFNIQQDGNTAAFLAEPKLAKEEVIKETLSQFKESNKKTAAQIAKERAKALANQKKTASQFPVTKLEIVRAEYGAANSWKDVTEVLRKRQLPSSRYIPLAKMNQHFGNPIPAQVKQLKVEYRIDDKLGSATFGENKQVVLPIPNKPSEK